MLLQTVYGEYAYSTVMRQARDVDESEQIAPDESSDDSSSNLSGIIVPVLVVACVVLVVAVLVQARRKSNRAVGFNDRASSYASSEPEGDNQSFVSLAWTLDGMHPDDENMGHVVRRTPGQDSISRIVPTNLDNTRPRRALPMPPREDVSMAWSAASLGDLTDSTATVRRVQCGPDATSVTSINLDSIYGMRLLHSCAVCMLT